MAGRNFQSSPGQFKVKDANLEQTLERFERYMENMHCVFPINRPRTSTGPRIEFDDCNKKDIIQCMLPRYSTVAYLPLLE